MANKITVPMTFDAEALLKDVFENLPEYSDSLVCTKWNYENNTFTLVDGEDDKTYILNLDNATPALKKLLEMVDAGKLNFGMTVCDLMDASNWDAIITDALIQIAVLGEIVYG